ncbi:MAG: DNA polymerase III subunit delta [Bacteroidales bacterium]|jgi:DNA polymerase-3 subunit delta|nr:DNA polymerase III subunit delta [Bacteroidales bacterium]
MAKTKKESNTISFKDICKQIDKKELAPIYLLTGAEPYYIDKLCEQFENVLTEEEKDFNFNIVYGKDMDVEQVIATAKQYPMFSERRVVIIKEAQIADKRMLEKAEPYFRFPSPQTTLVICNKSDSFAAGLKKLIATNGVVFESSSLYDNQVPKWIDDYLKEQNLGSEAGVSQMIADFLGNNLQKITNEISKLALNLKQPFIGIADVKAHIGESKDYNVFELQEALAKRDVTKANRIVAHFYANPKDNPFQMVLPILFSYFVKVIKVAQLTDKSNASVARAIGINPYRTAPYLSAASNYPLGKLFLIIEMFREYDMRSKGVNNSPMATDGDLLKELVFRILY